MSYLLTILKIASLLRTIFTTGKALELWDRERNRIRDLEGLLKILEQHVKEQADLYRGPSRRT